jgi:hypothetical protein
VEVVFRRCCGLDIRKEKVLACVMIQEAGEVQKEVRAWRMANADFLCLHDWLAANVVTHVALGGVGIDWEPLFHLLGGSFTVLWVNTPDLKSLLGHREDIEDCEWIANLLSYGLLKESAVPPEPVPVLRDLLRYRKFLGEERTQEVIRLERILESAHLQLSPAAIAGTEYSREALLESLLPKTVGAEILSELGRGPFGDKVPLLRRALRESSFPAYQQLLLVQMLLHLDFLEEAFGQVSQEVLEQIGPLAKETICPKARPEGKTGGEGSPSQGETGGDRWPSPDIWRFPGEADLLQEKAPGENGHIIFMVARTLILVFLGMATYEFLKLCLFPGIDLFESERLTVGFVSLGAVMVTGFVARKQQFIRKNIEWERRRRIEAEMVTYRVRKRPPRSIGAGKPKMDQGSGLSSSPQGSPPLNGEGRP